MKCIDSIVERLNMAGICVGCFNINRKMYYSDKIKECFKSIANIDIMDSVTIQVCWECTAYINNIFRFKKTIEHSYETLMDCTIMYKDKIKLANAGTMSSQRLQPVATPVISVSLESEIQVKHEEDNYEKEENIFDYCSEFGYSDTEVKEEKPKTTETPKINSIKHRLNTKKKSKRAIRSGGNCKSIRPASKVSGTKRPRNKYICSEKQYICQYCAARCEKPAILKIHIRKHTGEKPYSCDMCPYRTAQRGNLSLHKRTHTQEKPYCCEFCPSKFAHKGNYLTHRRIHTGEKPYKCELCEYICSNKSALSRHKRTHTGEKNYVCDICSYKCADGGRLTRHKLMHSIEKKFSCPLCSYKGKRSCHLTRHMKRHARKDAKSISGDKSALT